MSVPATGRPDLFIRNWSFPKVFTNTCSSQLRLTSMKRQPKLLRKKVSVPCQCMNSRHWREPLSKLASSPLLERGSKEECMYINYIYILVSVYIYIYIYYIYTYIQLQYMTHYMTHYIIHCFDML